MKGLLSYPTWVVFLFFSFESTSQEINPSLDAHLKNKFEKIDANGFSKPGYDLFERGLIGFYNLKDNQTDLKKDVVTLIDFRQSSNNRRLWVIDLNENKVLYNTVVSHGKNTGEEYAKNFSNIPHTNKSSLGFYITGETYYGKHGLSLRLDGQETGFNDNARKRAIVMHGAAYATRDFAKVHGRLGRSFGCPAIPMKFHKEIIKSLANKTLLFIYFPEAEYEKNTKLNDRKKANDYILRNKVSV